jgi:MHS family proline/betaine transporter-like MFS transporter
VAIMMIEAVSANEERRAGHVRSIIAAIIGNALEWFDLVVYGFFAPTIAVLFFPTHDPAVGLILSLGTFGISFVVRPLGAILIGRLADRSGRKTALVLVSMLMMGGTLLIALLPTYAQIGVAAPALLLLARLVQGFSAGGEFGSATAYLAEQRPDRRAFFASWQFASQGISTLMASGLGLALTRLLSDAQLASWGWRLPFAVGLIIGPVAYFLRHHADETPEFLAAREARRDQAGRPADDRFAARFLVGCGSVLVATVTMYFMVYLPSFAKTALDLPADSGFAATLVAGGVLLVLPPLFGLLADRRGRLFVAIPAVALLLVLPVPLFMWLVAAPGLGRLICVEAVLSAVCASYFGALPALLSELFPVRVRTTGLSLSYNIAVVVAGGFAPMIFALLISATGSPWSPSLYISITAFLSLTALLAARSHKWTW